jgi:hypothetical protein
MNRRPVEQPDIRRISRIIAESLRAQQEAALVRKDPGLSSACFRDAAGAHDHRHRCWETTGFCDQRNIEDLSIRAERWENSYLLLLCFPFPTFAQASIPDLLEQVGGFTGSLYKFQAFSLG